jgi:hypothetical protein
MCLSYILRTLLAKTCVDKFKLSIATITQKLAIAEGKAHLNCIGYFLAKMTMKSNTRAQHLNHCASFES